MGFRDEMDHMASADEMTDGQAAVEQYDDADLTDGEYLALKEQFGAVMVERAREIVAERGLDQSHVIRWTEKFNRMVS